MILTMNFCVSPGSSLIDSALSKLTLIKLFIESFTLYNEIDADQGSLEIFHNVTSMMQSSFEFPQILSGFTYTIEHIACHSASAHCSILMRSFSDIPGIFI